MRNPNFTNEEHNVIIKVANEMYDAKDERTIHKIYRQARNWSRYHCYYAEACTPTRCRDLNREFSKIHNIALANFAR